jgi:hypothetical protein
MKLIGTGPSSPLSGHKIDSFIKCPQLWAYSNLIEPDPIGPRGESPALIKGSLGHQGLAHYYRRLQAEQEGEDPEKWLSATQAIELRGAQEGPSWQEFVTLAQTTVRAYARHYDGQQIKVRGVESVFALEGPGWKVTRSADLVVEAAGVMRIIDHKFVGRLTKTTVDRYALSGQFLDYALIGQEAWGERFGGTYLNLIEWPKGKSTPHFLQALAPAAPNAVAARRDALARAHAAKDHLAMAKTEPWAYPKRLHEQVCTGPYGHCKAYELCRFGRTAGQ